MSKSRLALRKREVERANNSLLDSWQLINDGEHDATSDESNAVGAGIGRTATPTTLVDVRNDARTTISTTTSTTSTTRGAPPSTSERRRRGADRHRVAAVDDAIKQLLSQSGESFDDFVLIDNDDDEHKDDDDIADTDRFVAVPSQQEFAVDDIVALESALRSDPDASVCLVPLADADGAEKRASVALSIDDSISVLRQVRWRPDRATARLRLLNPRLSLQFAAARSATPLDTVVGSTLVVKR